MKFQEKILQYFTYEKFREWVLSNKKRSAILFSLLILFLIIFFNNKGLLQRIKLESEKTELNKLIDQSILEQKKLEDYSRQLENEPAVIESVARVKYGMVKPGEQVYRISKD
ncbi:MAG: septum formation initiator family protein [Ignavibacteria bacterium]|nr:septum formation initiator family protein [Bacteroidota bacterium]MSQ46695.1 septum formation initiator family protein [Ignavibacteria bacterium]